MKCQVSRPRGIIALQGQLLAGPRRVMGGTRGMLRGGAMVDLWLPRVRVRCRCIRSCVEMHANPAHIDHMQSSGAFEGRSYELALQAEWDEWDDRARCPGLHPGLVELALQAVIAKGALGASRVCTHHG